MRSSFKTFWYFIGSFWFALVLICLTALYVVAGTFIESCTGSHWCAAHYTYSHPLFSFLLVGFFINILVSALRRWPFQKKHIPFLMTHLGLLMLISGVFIKIYWGTQGSMAIKEGSASADILITPSYAIALETPSGKQIVPVKIDTQSSVQIANGDRFNVLEWKPHSKPNWKDWIRDHSIIMRNVPPIPKNSEPVPLHHQPPWQATYSSQTPDEFLLHNGKLVIRNSITKNVIEEVPLDQFLQNGLQVNGIELSGEIKNRELLIHLINTTTEQRETFILPLDGKTAGWIHKRSEVLLPKRFEFEIQVAPTLVFTDDHLAAINSTGQILDVPLHEKTTLYAYDKGFGGYASSIEIPFLPHPPQRQKRWEEVAHILNENAAAGKPFAAPLSILQYHDHFSQILTQFLEDWHQCGTWLCSHSPSLPSLDWSSIHPQDYQRWKTQAALFQLLQNASLQGDNTLDNLKNMLHLTGDSQDVLELLATQTELFTTTLPSQKPSDSLLLSAALREQGITPNIFLEDPLEQHIEPITLETHLEYSVQDEAPLAKWEDNHPAALIEAKSNGRTERLWLSYDRYATQLKVPLLNGSYLVRLQSETQPIPYRIRLKEARQINYPGTAQPFSYEADIWITKKDGEKELATLSMNNVYETWDGYRFYLSNIAPGNREALQQVQIVVNRDPAKYLLTLPGFAILSCGVFLLLAKMSLKS